VRPLPGPAQYCRARKLTAHTFRRWRPVACRSSLRSIIRVLANSTAEWTAPHCSLYEYLITVSIRRAPVT
jgi:hypothetical protein